ncbi:hypothetical protein FRX31_002927 [Thalictrum thalictroides]|uniref:Uncharacterized protein n=1 Tax=Thalictrum thalictroides TaxID=46969 RepID=A0A7J6XEY5_THATH|nr:hypothetical protein FRX31_002927 [Thalictrum thalictroides]
MDNPNVEEAILHNQTILQEHDDELQSIAFNWYWTGRSINKVRKSVCDNLNLEYNNGHDRQWYTYECKDCKGLTGDNKHFGYPPYNAVGRWE